MAEIANDLELVSANIGRVETNIVQLRTDLASMETLQAHDDERIDALRASTSSDSKQQRIIDFIESLQPILQGYADRRRDQLAQPLSEAFEDGFELLSRKAKQLKHIGVSLKIIRKLAWRASQIGWSESFSWKTTRWLEPALRPASTGANGASRSRGHPYIPYGQTPQKLPV